MKKTILILLSFVALASAQAQDTLQLESLIQTHVADTLPAKIKLMGYRVQIYYGGNDRNAKNEANRRANRANVWFGEHKVYTFFQSPHWKCQVGNFRTRREAEQLLNEMRDNGRFPGAVIVRAKVVMSRHDYEASLRNDTVTDTNAAVRDTTACR